MKCRVYLFFICLFIQHFLLKAQELPANKNYYVAAIGFWNLENLYDTLNDQWKNDEDFTPVGTNTWTGERYRIKINHLSEAISRMAIETSPDGLAILGLCEVENHMVVEDLVNAPALRDRKYMIVHIEGPDARGVDPSFVYNPKYFTYLNSFSYPVKVITDSLHRTRDILVVNGLFLGEMLTVLVNHWPSRRGGELASRPNRNYAAKLVRHLADSILLSNPTTKLIIMGDLNDDPTNESVKSIIGTYAEYKFPKPGLFYNPMENLFKKGIGSLAFQDSWNLFDQIILNQNWVKGDYKTWEYFAVRIFNKPFLCSDLPSDKGYPFRTFSGPKYTGGYSDHFPVYILIAKEKK